MSALVGYNINTDGLSLYLDARNPTSYPGNGNIWYDLSVGANNVSTSRVYYENSPIPNFTSSYNLNSYVDYYAPNLTTIATVETVCQIISLNAVANVIFGWNTYVVYVLNPQTSVVFTTNSGTGDYLASGQGLTTGQWYYLVFEMRSDVSYVNNKIYINGVNQNLTAINPPENSSNRNFSGGNGRIASYGTMSPFANYTGNNKYAMFRVYNRTLSQQEITNNYNYYKPIFNLD